MHITGHTILLTLAAGSTVSAAVVSQNTVCGNAASTKISSSVSSQVSSSVSAQVAASISSKVSASVSASVASSISAQLAAKTSSKSSVKLSSASKQLSISTSAKSSTKVSVKPSSTSISSKSSVKSSSTSQKASSTIPAKSSTSSAIKTSTKISTSSQTGSKSSSTSKLSSKTSSSSTLAPIPTDPAKIDYKLAPIPDFQDASKFSIDKGPYAESAHFRLYGQNNENTTIGLQHLEGTWNCYVDKLGWRSSGLASENTDGRPPYYKTNYFIIDNLVQYGFSGRTYQLFDGTGAGFVIVDSDYITQLGVMSHEYGHVLSMAEPAWWNQQNTYGWAETLGNYVAETYRSDLCADSRAAANDTIGTGGTAFQAFMTIGQSYRSLVDPYNKYMAWPFLSYLTYNLDGYTGFGANTLRTIFTTYNAKANETPFHTINRMAVSAGTTVQKLVGKYWARMAFADYGNPVAQNYFRYLQSGLDYNNTFAVGGSSSSKYQVYSDRAPRYFGASIIPLHNVNATGVTATVTAQTSYMAYLVVQAVNVGVRFGNKYGDIRYIELVNSNSQGGIVKTASTDIAEGDEVMLVVANTPDKLLMYDATQSDTGAAAAGMDFTFTLEGASN